MLMPAALAGAFPEALVDHGLLVPAGPLGVPGRGAVFEAVLSAFDALVLRAAHTDGAQVLLFPPVIDRAILERTGYLEGFPTLCGSVHAFAGTEAEATAFAARVACVRGRTAGAAADARVGGRREPRHDPHLRAATWSCPWTSTSA